MLAKRGVSPGAFGVAGAKRILLTPNSELRTQVGEVKETTVVNIGYEMILCS